ncbi:unnamed protein product [Adineta ricciae]|uniref:Uncharacterized protein n=2 Tax=Adineta ricciae TaxID=249248 RepID=A0A815NLU0_ADIRI|nr:unnamed protein product [Adineta ricciae]CAF1441489.1 unnamed protein product [Adineta ricciae]
MNSEQSESSSLPRDLWSYSDNVFYSFVKTFVGEIEGEILEIQCIKNVQILLQVPDVFSFFRLNCKEISALKKKACFLDDDMNFLVRPGIKYNIEEFINLLNRHFEVKLMTNNTIPPNATASAAHNNIGQCVCGFTNIDTENDEYESEPFINIFLNNLLKNMKRPKNNFRFNDIIKKFASVLRILAGNNAYEFIRINLPGALPSNTTLENYDANMNFELKECEFRFDMLKDYMQSIKSEYVFSSEDATGVVSSVSYDAVNDCFIGFTSPLNNGLPIVDRFKTNNYNELEEWFENIDKSTLVNVHLIEPLLKDVSSLVHSRPYILSGYGINNKHSAYDTIRRWIHIYNQCKQQNVNVVGFSTDCDSRYFKAMRLALGFFSRAPNVDLLTGNNDAFVIDIPSNWKFFFMRPQQLFLCMQDGPHLVTKIRNRLLSDVATLYINDDHININHLLELIENHPKLDHNLVQSDIIPQDKQNYTSCLKITSNDVLLLLQQTNHKATYIYLYLLKLIILAYVKSDTEILTRLYFGWTVAFAYRIWWCSIRLNGNLSQAEKENSFITRAAWLSAEINIHTLTFIIILVHKGRLPPYALNIHLFSNQPCESTFRSARSLSASLSSITTFSVSQFMNKIGKISLLNQMKSIEESNNKEYSLKFPRHHKHRRDESDVSVYAQNVSAVTTEDIEKIIMKAYQKAESIMNNFELIKILKESNLDDVYKLSSFISHELNKKSPVDHSVINNYDNDDYDSLDEDEEDNVTSKFHNVELVESDEHSSDENEEEVCNLETSKQTFRGMKIYSNVKSTKINNYFKIQINNNDYYMHKQTAARLLTTNKNHLSSDRCFRVKQTSRQC